jgi:hypothetical protein
MPLSKPSRLVIVLFAIALALAALAVPLSSALGQTSGLDRAWQAAREAGSYRFTADAEITLLLATQRGPRLRQERDLRVCGEAVGACLPCGLPGPIQAGSLTYG